MKKLLLILLVCSATFINAQQLKVSTDKNPAIVGEQILIQYSINQKGDNFQSPNFNGLRVISGPNPSTQSSYSFVNGKSESTVSSTYSFYVQAIKEGNYNITPASIMVKRKTIQSESFLLKVVKGSEKNKSEQKALSEKLFIKVDVSKRNIVIGEQILVTYKLFTKMENLHNTELSSLPDLNGFWVKDLETSSRFKRDVINGVPYNVATIKKSVLTAQESGKLIIDPMELKCSIRVQLKRNNRDPFANFFGGGYNVKEVFINSNPITITVTELPIAPPKFNGAVGNMEIKSEIDNNKINANDAINYKIQIIGTGNIELIEPFKINFPSDFEVYDPKISEKIFEGGRKRSIKTFEYLLIPRYKGEYTIPSADFIVFNNKTRKYETKKTKRHNIIVLESKNNEQEGVINNQQLIKTEQKDINYIFTKTNLKKIGSNVISIKLFSVLFFLPILILILLLIYQEFIAQKDFQSKDWKNKQANKIALKRLKNAQDCIDNTDFDAFFEEIEKSIWGYFADKFKVNIAKLSKETISNHFQNSSININLEKEFIAVLYECEFARYAPETNKNAQMDTILQKTKNIIIEVETELK